MALGLFEKKHCDVCGEKIGLLGNRKLEDGNLCKDCAAKLSPWFSGRRHSSLEDVKKQLNMREQNRAKVAGFQWTKKLGKNLQALYVDETAGNFAVCYENDFKNGNPDILPLSCIKGCETKEEMHKVERKYKDKEGKTVSYNPPQYDRSCDYWCTLTVEHPYIDEIRFRLNDVTVKENGITGGLTFERDVRAYMQLCADVKSYIGYIGASAAGKGGETAQPEQELEFTAENVPYVSYEADNLVIDCSLTVPVKLSYRIENRACYDVMQKAGRSLAEGLKAAVPVGFILFQEKTRTPAIRISANLSELKRYMDKEFEPVCAAYGIKIADYTLTAVIGEKDRARIREAARQEQMRNPFGDRMGPAAAAAAAAQATSEWTCPACTAKNTGKFCEYCGTKRP